VTEQPPAHPRRATGRRRNWRLILAVGAGVLAVVCLGGLGVGYVLYERAARPDRSSPEITVTSYLNASLVDRDDARARLFECDDGEFSAIRALRDDIESRERSLGTTISVSAEDLRVGDRDSTSAVVYAEIRRSGMVDGAIQSVADQWTFALENEDGWRVCAADHVS
jgi:hypothetical protein